MLKIILFSSIFVLFLSTYAPPNYAFRGNYFSAGGGELNKINRNVSLFVLAIPMLIISSNHLFFYTKNKYIAHMQYRSVQKKKAEIENYIHEKIEKNSYNAYSVTESVNTLGNEHLKNEVLHIKNVHMLCTCASIVTTIVYLMYNNDNKFIKKGIILNNVLLVIHVMCMTHMYFYKDDILKKMIEKWKMKKN